MYRQINTLSKHTLHTWMHNYITFQLTGSYVHSKTFFIVPLINVQKDGKTIFGMNTVVRQNSA